MISVDTNIVVCLLTGDDPAQFKKAKVIFAKNNVMITTTVILECEWVLRYAYHFNQPEITNAFKSLFGLANVSLQEPFVIDTAIKWHSKGMDFADAIHLAKSQDSEAFITFDKKLIKSASKIATIPVKEP
jgi:predicted nucleic-acid-binding protein